MKGEEKLWNILNDKLETLRASSRLPEAIRVAETLLELAKPVAYHRSAGFSQRQRDGPTDVAPCARDDRDPSGKLFVHRGSL